MPRAPTPADIFDRAVEEGERRLDQSFLELVSTSFIAGFTIVFGLVALGIVEAIVEPEFGEVAKLAGALAFGVGLVFLVVGRTELFNENFSDRPRRRSTDPARGYSHRSSACESSPSSSTSSVAASSRSSSRSTARCHRGRRRSWSRSPRRARTAR